MTQPVLNYELSPVPESRRQPISSRGLRFLCRLGQGGMAEVHLANAAPPNAAPSLVVVKRMHQQHAQDAATVRMFLDEARLALCLSHPNIVQSQRLGVFEGRHGIVMEFLEGQPFHQVLKRACETEGGMNLEIVAQIAIAALDGLHHAHELKDVVGNDLGIVHRDISPQNLFISYDGAVKLLDFGIAKNGMQDGRTRTGLLKGKVSYMAPEQARGEELDRRADLWSLGVVLWEAVTGSRLFRAANEAATLNLTLSEAVSPPSSRRPDLPPELETILMRALQRSPSERYATAAAMRDDLETWLSNRELLPSASVAQLMSRLFGKEMREQRQQLQGLLQALPEPLGESGVTPIAPLLGGPNTLSGMRHTQVTTVADLMDELTRQRRVTTRLFGGLLALVVVTILAGLFLLQRAPASSASAARPVAELARSATHEAPAPEQATTLAAAPTPTGTPSLAPSHVPSAPLPRSTPAVAAAATHATRTTRAAATETIPEAVVPAAPAIPAETGLLNLDSSPWSVVSLGGRVLGQTPIVGATLPVGTHTLVLSNPEQGLKTTYQVTITAGHTTARRVGLD